MVVVGQGDGSAVGFQYQRRRIASVTAVRGAARGPGPVYYPLAFFAPAETLHGRFRDVPPLLRRDAILYRVCSRAGCRVWLPRVWVGYHGAGSNDTHDIARRCTSIPGLLEGSNTGGNGLTCNNSCP